MKERKWIFWIALCVLFLVFLFLIRSILLPFVLGTFTAYFLDPAADRLERLGLSRMRSTLIITGCFFFSIIALSLLIVPVLAGQFSGLVSALPSYINETGRHFLPLVNRWVGDFAPVDASSLKEAVANFSGVAMRFVGAFIAGLFMSGMAVVNLLSLFLITPVVAFYLLEEWDIIIARIDNWLPRAHADTIRSQIAIIDRTLAGFVRGQLNVCLLMSLYYTILLSAVGLHFSILIGVMTGFLLIIPYAGWMLGAGAGIAVAFFQFDSWAPIGFVVAVFVTGMALEGSVITPRLVGSKVGLHPVWIIFGMLSGAALFGFVGVLLAVPATAVIGVLIRFALDRYLASGYYRGVPAIRS